MRKTINVTVQVKNRDEGKKFIITEMPAYQAEEWAHRALSAIGRAGVELPDYIIGAGMAGLAILGISAVARARYEDAQPLLQEMMRCVQIARNPEKPNEGYEIIPSEIEEVQTLVWLRAEVFQLHVGFSIAAEKLNLISVAEMMAMTKSKGTTLDTKTSDQSSEPSSQLDKPPLTN